jgi:hypothetical protein
MRASSAVVLQTGYQLLQLGRIGTAYETFSRLLEYQCADVPLAFLAHNDSPADQRRCAEIYVADKYPPDGAPLPRAAPPGSGGAHPRRLFVRRLARSCSRPIARRRARTP